MTICHPIAMRQGTPGILRLKFCHQCSSWVHIIGPWEIHSSTIICRRTARHAMPSSCKIMKLLALRENELVLASAFIEWVWPDPDKSPEYEWPMVRMFVYDLRPLLAGFGYEIVVRHRWGYLLREKNAGDGNGRKT